MHRNGLRLAKLVNTLLDFSRIEAGRMRAHYEPVDLAAVTADLASVFRSAVERAGLEFIVNCVRLDEPVYVDRDMWEKVVLNLLSNALKFTFEGSIAVRVGGGDSAAVVTVSDTGVGVPAAEMPRLFERFHRVETVQARSNEGSGIGLALVKELVGLLGGSITVDSSQAGVPLSPSGCHMARHTCPPGRSPPTSPRGALRRPRPTCRKRCGGCLLTSTPGPLCRPGTPSLSRIQPRGPECWLPTTTPTCANTSPGCCAARTTASRPSATAGRRWPSSAPRCPTW
ncbi:hypothetical protein NIIDMKKI_71640 [Mycobacterium kansasii]|uniref:histidine kinase n=1 Tax=Mycobacterium kansasii TaxID=1768 RepID=A0A7G1IT44_MYCKA|nr:hypothetical protein NIIDMKKI_71640 [Mycobacterium kansasii]